MGQAESLNNSMWSPQVALSEIISIGETGRLHGYAYGRNQRGPFGRQLASVASPACTCNRTEADSAQVSKLTPVSSTGAGYEPRNVAQTACFRIDGNVDQISADLSREGRNHPFPSNMLTKPSSSSALAVESTTEEAAIMAATASSLKRAFTRFSWENGAGSGWAQDYRATLETPTRWSVKLNTNLAKMLQRQTHGDRKIGRFSAFVRKSATRQAPGGFVT